MTPKQEKAFCKAMTATLHAYEDLIKCPEKNIHKWTGYGAVCSICETIPESTTQAHSFGRIADCLLCPLRVCENVSFDNLVEQLYRFHYVDLSEINNVVKAAKKRYNWLIKKIGKAGFEYK